MWAPTVHAACECSGSIWPLDVVKLIDLAGLCRKFVHYYHVYSSDNGALLACDKSGVAGEYSSPCCAFVLSLSSRDQNEFPPADDDAAR
eukprot:scaffold333278_cov16-Prasinocladus_malaysianus.AAC.1